MFLIISIVCKLDVRIYNFVKNNVYGDSTFVFYFNDFFNKYFGGIFPINSFKEDVQDVFYEDIKYDNIESYLDGAKLYVDEGYLIPSRDLGVVVYVGKKDNYGDVVIILNREGINVWYGNICNSKLRLYDNVNKGDYIGNSCGDYMYMVYSKNGRYLDYRNYLK